MPGVEAHIGDCEGSRLIDLKSGMIIKKVLPLCPPLFLFDKKWLRHHVTPRRQSFSAGCENYPLQPDAQDREGPVVSVH